MEEALQTRVIARHKNVSRLIEDANKILNDEGGTPLIEVTQVCLQLKTAIGALERETFIFMEKCGDKDQITSQSTDVQMKAENILAALEAMSRMTVTERTAPEQVARLPKLDLAKFNGDVLKWTEFWDKFEANIDSRSMKDVDKLSYLLSTLEGAALETVEGLGATNANYAIAVDVLQKRYGAKDKVVDAHYAAINQLKVAASISSECRRNLNLIERHLRILSSYGENINSNHLRVAISSKFPGPVLYQVKLLAKNSEITELRACLEKVIIAMEQSDVPTPSSSISNAMQETTTEALHSFTKQQARRFRPRRQEPQKVNFAFNRKRKASTSRGPEFKRARTQCIFCNGDHYSDQCEKYSTFEERRNKLGSKCFICFKEGHRARRCNKAARIKCFHCKKQHNSALCSKKFAIADSKSCSPLDLDKYKMNSFLTNIKSYLQTATANLVHNNKTVPCRLLLDCGSQRSYLSTKMAKQLDLTTDIEDQLVIFTFGSSTPKEMSSPVTDVRLVTKRGIQKEIRVNLVPYITDRIPIPVWNAEDLEVDLCADDNSVGEGIDLLIGNDFYFSFMRNEHIKIQENLYLVNTDFGWIISGNYHKEQKDNILSIVTYCQCHEPGCTYFNEPDLPLRTIDMKFLWALESIGITDSPKATREEEAVKHFNETVEYRNGRYEVKWPWIDFPPELPTNFGLAYGRLKSLLRRSDKETIKDYQEILKEQLESGIIEIVQSQPSNKSVPIHYLPHHIVKQDGKRGRIVYDASAKLNGQRSLNECLYRGPSMIEDMTALILQFRTGKIGITADVEKAFLQVGLQEDDREVTRFLWLKDPTQEPSENNLLYFRFCRVPFGIISSPFLLTATIRYHFSQTNQPLLKKIADKCYVDNLVTNAESVSEATKVYKETREAFGEIAMNIRDWTSNSDEFMANVPELQKHKSMDTVKVLGLLWNLKDDTLRLKINDNMIQKDVWQVKTKKDVLRMLARFYDPCGFIAPLILPAKLLFQELCMKKFKWDTVMPEDLKERWNSIIQNLQSTKSVILQRHAGGDNYSKYELHTFTDASKNSYACVVYLRTTTNGTTKVDFLMAKSRVTPIEDKDDLKIPRLELLGYLIGNRLLKYVQSNLDLPIQQAYLWTDSLIVLSWMKSSKLLPPFVSRRINEIKESKNVEFRYVNSSLNPADLATRPELWQQKKDLWLNGPTFLTLHQNCWPSITRVDENTALLSAGEALEVVDGPEMVEKGYEGSEDGYMVDVLAVTGDEMTGTYQDKNADIEVVEVPVVTEEPTQSNDEIKKIQLDYFPDEVAGKITHLTRNLGLYLDVDGIIRCKGRMSNANWTYDKKHPILFVHGN